MTRPDGMDKIMKEQPLKIFLYRLLFDFYMVWQVL